MRQIAGAKGIDPYQYLNFMGYDKFEARVRMRLGNGTSQDYAYNPLHRRMTNLLAFTPTGKNGPRTFMDMGYGYDDVGNILSLSNSAPIPSSPSLKGGQSDYTFGYDDLYQLTTANGEYRYPKNKTERFTLDMAYDEIHNIVDKDQLAGRVKKNGSIQEDKKITYDWGYQYNSSRPHAATLIGDRTFLYDLNGNQVGWDSNTSGQQRRIVWDEENRIQEIADNGRTSRYKYDEDTNRVVKRGPGGETLYINQWYVANNGRNSKHVFAGETRITTKLEMSPTGEGNGPDIPGGGNGNGNGNGNSGNGNNGNGNGNGGNGNSGGGNNGGNNNANQPGGYEKFQYFYHPDHLGSTSYITDELGEVYQNLEPPRGSKVHWTFA